MRVLAMSTPITHLPWHQSGYRFTDARCGIIARSPAGPAPTNPRQGHPRPCPRPMRPHTISGIVRACWQITALTPNKGRQCQLIDALRTQKRFGRQGKTDGVGHSWHDLIRWGGIDHMGRANNLPPRRALPRIAGFSQSFVCVN